MTKQAHDQHVDDKEDEYHKGYDPYPFDCACGRRFVTSEDVTSHREECPLNMVRV
jgi:hypothetical protein